MASTFPGSVDSFGAAVADGVDFVLATHVNDLRNAAVATETTLRNLLVVKNTSGATAAANDVGYISAAGEYKTTTTAADIQTWCVVIAGAANNSDIVVVQQGRVTVKYTSTAPTAGQFLTTSTVAGQSLAVTDFSPAVFAVALATGSAGTVSALLVNLYQRRPVGENLLSDTLTHEESWQNGTTINDIADDNYGPVLWNILNDTNAPDITGQAGGSTDPFSRSLRVTIDAGTPYTGAVQFLSAQQSKALRGSYVSLSADLLGSGVTALRMAVIVWTSTADTITSDVVGTWAAGNPTLASNWAYIGTPASITVSATRTRFSVQNLLVPTNANNIGVFIWTPATEGAADYWEVSRVKLEVGPVATDFIPRAPVEELELINRFYWKSFAIATTPAQNIGVNTSGILRFPAMVAGAAVNRSVPFSFPVRMRIAPTLTFYNPAAANGEARDTGAAADCSATGSGISSEWYISINATGAAGTAVGNALQVHAVADARL